jgi:hypothetical protein
LKIPEFFNPEGAAMIEREDRFYSELTMSLDMLTLDPGLFLSILLGMVWSNIRLLSN